VTLFTVLAWAADISGTWKAEFTAPDGSARQNTFTFKQDGEKLTGTVASAMGEAQIQDGKVTGEAVSFFVMRNFGGNDVKLSYAGKVAGNEIKFKVSFEGADQELEITAKKVS
jgi:hypothetical protein